MRAKNLGALGLANAQPPGHAKFANAQPLDWQGKQMPRSSRGGGREGLGPAVIDWCITKSTM